ncbi:MAG: LSM domain-containing protein [Candidatus Hydrothermarchaeaceae archaeon]
MAELQLDEHLASNVGKLVHVRLKNGMKFRGVLRGFDEYINIVISDAEEILPEGNGKRFDTLIFKGGLVGFLGPSD